MIGVAVTITTRGMQVFAQAAVRLPGLMASAVRRTAQTAAPVVRAAVQQARIRSAQAVKGLGAAGRWAGRQAMAARRHVRGPRLVSQHYGGGVVAGGEFRYIEDVGTGGWWQTGETMSGLYPRAGPGEVVVKPAGPMQQRIIVRPPEKEKRISTGAKLAAAATVAELARRSVGAWSAVEGAAELLQRLFPKGMPILGTIESKGTGTGVEYYIGGTAFQIAGAFKMPQRDETMEHANRQVSARAVMSRRRGRLFEHNLLQDYMRQISLRGVLGLGAGTQPREQAAQRLKIGGRVFAVIRTALRRQLLVSVDTALGIGR